MYKISKIESVILSMKIWDELRKKGIIFKSSTDTVKEFISKHGRELRHHCPMCDYVVNSVCTDSACFGCPYHVLFGYCGWTHNPYGKWSSLVRTSGRDKKKRKYWANRFYHELVYVYYDMKKSWKRFFTVIHYRLLWRKIKGDCHAKSINNSSCLPPWNGRK